MELLLITSFPWTTEHAIHVSVSMWFGKCQPQEDPSRQDTSTRKSHTVLSPFPDGYVPKKTLAWRLCRRSAAVVQRECTQACPANNGRAHTRTAMARTDSHPGVLLTTRLRMTLVVISCTSWRREGCTVPRLWEGTRGRSWAHRPGRTPLFAEPHQRSDQVTDRNRGFTDSATQRRSVDECTNAAADALRVARAHTMSSALWDPPTSRPCPRQARHASMAT